MDDRDIWDRALSNIDLDDFQDVDDPNKFDDLNEALKQDIKELLNQLKDTRGEQLEHYCRQNQGFEDRLKDRWGEGFDLLESFLYFSLETGSKFNQVHREEAAANGDYVFDALVRLHARGCRIAREILTLLQSGYIDGALARWRALHETTAVAMFISENGQDTAERYLLHAGVLAAYAAEEYEEYEEVLNLERINEKQKQKAKRLRAELVECFQTDYKSYYGWAEPDLTDGVGIKNIIDAVDLDHLKPYYRLASYSIHPASIAIQETVQLDPREEQPSTAFLRAGPKNKNLDTPAQLTAISMNQLTATLILSKPEPRWLVTAEVSNNLVTEVIEAFVATQLKLLEEIKQENSD